jgi:hypothetical protein
LTPKGVEGQTAWIDPTCNTAWSWPSLKIMQLGPRSSILWFSQNTPSCFVYGKRNGWKQIAYLNSSK